MVKIDIMLYAGMQLLDMPCLLYNLSTMQQHETAAAAVDAAIQYKGTS